MPHKLLLLLVSLLFAGCVNTTDIVIIEDVTVVVVAEVQECTKNAKK